MTRRCAGARALEWALPPIGAVCIPTEQRNPTDTPAVQFRYVDIAGVDRVRRIIAEHRILLGAEAPSRARQVIRKDDVLVSTVRPNLNAVAMVPDELDDEIASTGFCVLRANRSLVEPRYLFYRAICTDFVTALSAKVRGANYPAVSDGDVRDVQIPLPPLSEQRRIVEILDQADRLRRLRAEADTKADRILPALLTSVLGPVSDWDLHPSSRPLGELVEFVSGSTPSKRDGRLWNGEIPWVSPKDMKDDFIRDTEDHVSLAAVRDAGLRTIKAESVLLVVRGMILARSVPVALNLTPVTINQDMKALVPRIAEVTGRYLWAALYLARTRLLALVRTAAHGTRKLDSPDLLNVRIIVPPAEQRCLVEGAVRARELNLERRRDARLGLSQLFTVLLHGAFSGELTASWREGHMKELLQEMEAQAKALASR